MDSKPRGLRPHIILAGPCNGGKSSLLNSLVESEVAIVAAQAGTTTDPVYKNLELLPFGPVTFVDTPGLDDTSELGGRRVDRSVSALGAADMVLCVARPSQVMAVLRAQTAKARVADIVNGLLGGESLAKEVPLILVLTHADLPDEARDAAEIAAGVEIASGSGGIPGVGAGGLSGAGGAVIVVSNEDGRGIASLKSAMISALESSRKDEKRLLENLVRAYKLVLMIVPVDLEAPAGRLILPQVQALREVLDSDAASLLVKDREIEWALGLLKSPPDLAICDSQVVLKASASVPPSIPLTTFSILFSRQKGDLDAFVAAAKSIDRLKDGDTVVVAETCAHHTNCDDIGRVKIPRWIRQYTGRDLDFRTVSGPLPPDLAGAKLIVHCGGCMITRRMMLSRMGIAASRNIPITNYGVAISHVQGVLDRVTAPFRV